MYDQVELIDHLRYYKAGIIDRRDVHHFLYDTTQVHDVRLQCLFQPTAQIEFETYYKEMTTLYRSWSQKELAEGRLSPLLDPDVLFEFFQDFQHVEENFDILLQLIKRHQGFKNRDRFGPPKTVKARKLGTYQDKQTLVIIEGLAKDLVFVDRGLFLGFADPCKSTDLTFNAPSLSQIFQFMSQGLMPHPDLQTQWYDQLDYWQAFERLYRKDILAMPYLETLDRISMDVIREQIERGNKPVLCDCMTIMRQRRDIESLLAFFSLALGYSRYDYANKIYRTWQKTPGRSAKWDLTQCIRTRISRSAIDYFKTMNITNTHFDWPLILKSVGSLKNMKLVKQLMTHRGEEIDYRPLIDPDQIKDDKFLGYLVRRAIKANQVMIQEL